MLTCVLRCIIIIGVEGGCISMMYTVKEVSKITKVAENSVRRWLSQGKLQACKAGGRVLISEEDLNKFLGKK